MIVIRLPESKVSLAVGLDRWEVLDPYEGAHQSISKWRADQFTYAVMYKAPQGNVYGLVMEQSWLAEREQFKGTRLLAFAACVALHPKLHGKTAFVTIELEGGVIAVGLERGVVVVDQLCDGGEVDEARTRYEQRIRGVPYDSWGSALTIESPPNELQLEEVLPKRGGPTVEPLRSTRGIAVVLAIGVIAAVAGGGWFAYDQMNANIKKIAAQQLLISNSPAAQYERSVQQLLATPVVPLSGAVATFREGLADTPIYVAGWELRGVTCASTGTCSLRYRRLLGSSATYDEFKAAAPASWQGTGAAGEDVSVATVSFKLPASKLERSAWPTNDDFLQRNRNQWQFLAAGGWRGTLGQRSLQGVGAGIDPKAAPTLAGHPSAVFAVPVQVTAQSWLYADDDPDSPMNERFLGQNTVMAGDIELEFNGKEMVFSAKGLSYVR